MKLSKVTDMYCPAVIINGYGSILRTMIIMTVTLTHVMVVIIFITSTALVLEGFMVTYLKK